MNVSTQKLLDLEHTIASELFKQTEYPWEVLGDIHDFILRIGPTLEQKGFNRCGEDIWIANDVKLAPTAFIGAPCIIGHGTEVRHCAFIRGNAIIGDGAVIGNSTEIKNSIIFDGAQVPHYNYVGDSIIGYKAHMGAGAVTSNVKCDKTPVVVHAEDNNICTGRKKFGAVIGDFCEVGCGSVLNPGTVLGRRALIYPLSSVRGCVPEENILKTGGKLCKKQTASNMEEKICVE